MGGFVVAIYAATVATIAVGWEIYKWLGDRRPAIRVEVSLDDAGLEDTEEPDVTVTAFNIGDTPVGIREIGFWRRDLPRGERRMTPEMSGTYLPSTLEPQASADQYAPVSEIRRAGINTAKPVVGYACLLGGKVVKSKPTRLLPSGKQSPRPHVY